MNIKVGYFNIAFSIINAINNTFNLILLDQFTLWNFCHSVLPFIITGVIFFLIRHNNVRNSYLLLGIGLISLSGVDYTNTVGITLFCFGCLINKSQKYALVGIVLIVCALLAKIFIHRMSITNTLSAFVLYFFILSTFFGNIYQAKQAPIKGSKLTPEQHEVLCYLDAGYTYKEIVDKLSEHVSIHTVRKRVQRACKKYNCRTSHQLISRLSKLGHIAHKMDN